MKNLAATLIVLICLSFNETFAQSLSVNTDGSLADSSAILDVKSTSKGVLVPRVTSAQKNGIVSPAVGLLVFQTDNDKGFYYYNGAEWLLLLGVSVNSNTNTLVYTTRGF